MPYLNYTVGLFNIYLAKGPKVNVMRYIDNFKINGGRCNLRTIFLKNRNTELIQS